MSAVAAGPSNRTTIEIAVPPFCSRYGSQELPKLRERLAYQAATEPVVIHKPEDVLLNGRGLIQHRYRLTTTGLSQLCSAIAPGLAACVASTAGLRREAGRDRDAISQVVAVQLLNAVIRLRFADRLAGQALVVDRGRGRVEGLVGPRYEFFPNLGLLDLASEFAQQHDVPFVRGAISGRRVQLRFCQRRPLLRLSLPDRTTETIYGGWSFSNSEIGDCAVRAGLLLFHKQGKASSLLEIGRVVHVKGGRLLPKISRLLARLPDRGAREFEELGDKFRYLLQTPLALGGDSEAHARRVQWLTSRLARRLPRRAAEKVLQRTIAGSFQIDGQPYDRLNAALVAAISGRNAFDLYNALTSVAATLPPEQQEPAEQLAYSLLNGQVKLFQ